MKTYRYEMLDPQSGFWHKIGDSSTLTAAEDAASDGHKRRGLDTRVLEVTTREIRRWHDPDLSIEYETPNDVT
jgi:hypothetical protein